AMPGTAPRKARISAGVVRRVLQGPADQARRRLRRLRGAPPPMRDVPTLLVTAHARELELAAELDALVILARERGMSWAAIGASIGVTRQGAMARHARAVERLGAT